MGGLFSLLAAEARPDRIKGIVGVSTALNIYLLKTVLKPHVRIFDYYI